MAPYLPVQTNGYIENMLMMSLVGGSLFAGTYTDSMWLSVWYGVLGLIVLYLAKHFDRYNFDNEAWAESQPDSWGEKSGLMGSTPNMADFLSRHYNNYGYPVEVITWGFRLAYIGIGLMLLTLSAEHLLFGTRYLWTYGAAFLMSLQQLGV